MMKDTSSIAALVPRVLEDILLPVVCDHSTTPLNTKCPWQEHTTEWARLSLSLLLQARILQKFHA